MTEAVLKDLLYQTFSVLIMIVGPLVGTSLLVGVVISILQAVTHIQEQTLTFVPKLISLLILFGLMGFFFLNQLVTLFESIFYQMSQL